MGRRAARGTRPGHRCPACRMHVAWCVCDDIPRLSLRTRIVVVMHQRERHKTTATAPLALQAIESAELHLHGLPDAPLDLRHLHDEGRRVLVLFPSEDAVELAPSPDRREVTLVVPDGSWRQASKAVRRIPGLAEAPKVVLPAGPPTAWRLRREPREGGLATLEAIARAVGVLESPEAQAALEALFRRVVERTLWTRQPSPDRRPD